MKVCVENVILFRGILLRRGINLGYVLNYINSFIVYSMYNENIFII